MAHPVIIQGGMGAGVSDWRLARTVSEEGQLGVVSGTAVDEIMVRRLQIGDPGGYMRQALENFPDQDMVDRILGAFFIPGGKAENEPFKQSPMLSAAPEKMLVELTVAANFAEVFLAKQGHENPVGINLLEKIQSANLYAIYGAMLGGVDYVIMGAGIPREIPGVIDNFVTHQQASLKLQVQGASSKDDLRIVFDPKAFFDRELPDLKRPFFLGIISSNTLAAMLAKKATGRIDGFVIETPAAGGHNAPPRGRMKLNSIGEPVYGERDEVDIEKIKALGLPFWMAGTWGSFDKLKEAISLGAEGVQVGTAFAFTRESGFSQTIKEKVISMVLSGKTKVFADPRVSPTGFPFKVASVEGTLSEVEEYLARKRICDQGYLRHVYKKENGQLGYRCPAEPVKSYIKKGGRPEDTEGRKCLCNALIANLGLAQIRKNGYVERPLVTSGDGLKYLGAFLKNGSLISARDAIKRILYG